MATLYSYVAGDIGAAIFSANASPTLTVNGSSENVYFDVTGDHVAELLTGTKVYYGGTIYTLTGDSTLQGGTDTRCPCDSATVGMMGDGEITVQSTTSDDIILRHACTLNANAAFASLSTDGITGTLTTYSSNVCTQGILASGYYYTYGALATNGDFGLQGIIDEAGALQNVGIFDAYNYHYTGTFDGSDYHAYGIIDSSEAYYPAGIFDGSTTQTTGIFDGVSWNQYGIIYDQLGIPTYADTGMITSGVYYANGILDSAASYYPVGIYDGTSVSAMGIYDSSAVYSYGIFDTDTYYPTGIATDSGFQATGIWDGTYWNGVGLYDGANTYGSGIMMADTTYYETGVLVDFLTYYELTTIPAKEDVLAGVQVLGEVGTLALGDVNPFPTEATRIGPYPLSATAMGPYPII